MEIQRQEREEEEEAVQRRRERRWLQKQQQYEQEQQQQQQVLSTPRSVDGAWAHGDEDSYRGDTPAAAASGGHAPELQSLLNSMLRPRGHRGRERDRGRRLSWASSPSSA